jgi:hypothetical protein
MTIPSAFRRIIVALGSLVAVFVLCSASASAESCPAGSVYAQCGAGWMLTASTFPATLAPGGEGQVIVTALNDGAGQTNGPITITDTLPPGVTAFAAGDFNGPLYPPRSEYNQSLWKCAIAPGNEENSIVTCTNGEELEHVAGGGGTYNNLETLAWPGHHLDPILSISVDVPTGPVERPNRVAVAGGSAPASASTEDPIEVGTNPGKFRFTNFDAWFSNANGTVDTQAGSHPYAATFSFNLASEWNEEQFGPFPVGGNAKEIDVDLPPGFVGDPTAVPQCTRQQLDEVDQQEEPNCPNATQVGRITVRALFGELYSADVFNVVPPAGVPNALGFVINGIRTILETGVRSGSDYGLISSTPDTPEKSVMGAVLTLWGEPGDPSHDIWRRPGSSSAGCSPEELASSACTSPGVGKPFLTLPTACAGPQQFSIRANTWEDQAVWTETVTSMSHDSSHQPVGFTGCEHLAFAPKITTEPDTARADTPAGLTVEVKPSIGGLSEAGGLSTSDIQNTTVTLPEGFVINPGQAAGLQACQPAQDGLTTEAEKAEGREDDGPASCPNASKVGTDEIETPLLPHDLRGDVYILQSNPPELKLLVTASGEGVNLKLVGVVHLNEQTGQLTTKFEGTPQLPFSDFDLKFSGGAQAALDTPTQCGTYTTTSDFTPWSSMPGSSENFLADTFPTAAFSLTEGPGGGSCSSSPLPFAPTLTAGSTTDQAGGFTNFSLLLQRGDGQQRISGLQFKAPAGLTGELSKVPLCTNAQAETNTCPEASKIGHTVVESGPGPYPLVVPEPGQEAAPIYLTETYGGAPFGLSIVVPLHVGPFVLPTQRVRAKVEINPTTAALTITTNELPQIVAGVPTDLREVDAVVEKPEFMVNPTNCDPQEFSGTAYGTPPPGAGGPGAQAAISSHFQVGSCRSLEFAPKFSVSTSGKTSKELGASLTAKVSEPDAPQGTQANITKVKVELPKVLPSRLTTLQKACTNAQFEVNPAGCPSESKIGYAVVHTPLLPVPLQGPAIFVSHGDEAFPSLTLVLQGDGVTIVLVGATRIKNGVTSTTFNTVPDQPFSAFELTLPEGKFSALTANNNLCAPTKTVTVNKKEQKRVHGKLRRVTVKVKKTETESLLMPSEFVGQNGAVIKQSTKISVTGCPKPRPVKKVTKKKKRRGGK